MIDNYVFVKYLFVVMYLDWLIDFVMWVMFWKCYGVDIINIGYYWFGIVVL